MVVGGRGNDERVGECKIDQHFHYYILRFQHRFTKFYATGLNAGSINVLRSAAVYEPVP